MRCFNSLLKSYSVVLNKFFLVFLISAPLFLVLCAVLSFVPGIAPDLPDFSNPVKGFEPRGTYVMKRVVTAQETLRKAIKSNELTCSPQTLKRTARATPQHCYNEYDFQYFYGAKAVYESGSNMMDVASIIGTCYMQQKLYTQQVCRIGTYECCPGYSLGNYIAELNNKKSCFDITGTDVAVMNTLLQNCSSLFISDRLDVSCNGTDCICYNNKEMIKNIFTYLVDKDFTRGSDILKTTMIWSPFRYSDYEYFKEIFQKYLNNEDEPLEKNGVKLVAFDLTDFKFDYFNEKLLTDAVFPAVGLACIAIILLIYTHSFFIMFLTLFSIISSLVISYFIYHTVFRLKFFPFLNVTTFIFLVGIGADDAFVFSDIWNQAKLAMPRDTSVTWMEYTLRHGAVSMLVTSLTTSAAFYANIVSDITAIRLFGIFAGTTIIINYVLMITWFPAGIIALERWKEYGCCPGSRKRPEDIVLDNMSFQQQQTQQPNIVQAVPTESPHGEHSAPELKCASGHHSNTDDRQVEQQSTTKCGPCRLYTTLRSKCSQFLTRLFEIYIPKCLSLFPIWLFILLAIGVGMLCAITVSPGLKRPKSSDFQVFSSSHPLEQYDLNYKQTFRGGSNTQGSFYVYMFFGVKPEDNGNYLEPDNFGHLVYDSSFDIVNTKSQVWLVDLCSRIRNQPFFDSTIEWDCIPELLKSDCPNNTASSFPFSREVLGQCFASLYQRGKVHCYSGFDSPIYYDSSGNVKLFALNFPTNVPFSNDYEAAKSLWDDIQEFSSDVFSDAPDGLVNGWVISDLRFFALQHNLGTSTMSSLGLSILIAFLVILVTSLNWLISVYAIVTILFILSTTVGSLVLAGWELNILESIVISVAVGLSVDFTLHYGVAYIHSTNPGRQDQIKFSLSHIGPAVTLAALTTFIAGAFMMFSNVLVYFQLGQFLTLVMAVSWFYGTFFFLSLCYFAGPVGYFAKINSCKCCSCEVSPIYNTEDEHL